MGQKINFYGFCFGVMIDYKICWYVEKQYVEFVGEDVKI